jgi:hypothetical protein
VLSTNISGTVTAMDKKKYYDINRSLNVFPSLRNGDFVHKESEDNAEG